MATSDEKDPRKSMQDALAQKEKERLITFYAFNKDVLQEFKAVAKQFQALLNEAALDATIVDTIIGQTERILPELNALKFELDMLAEEDISIACRKEIEKQKKYITEIMVLSQVAFVKDKFLTLLENNQHKLVEEKTTEESRMRMEAQEKKKAEEEKERQEEARKQKERLEQISIEKEIEVKLRLEEEKKRKEEEIAAKERQLKLKQQQEEEARKKTLELEMVKVEGSSFTLLESKCNVTLSTYFISKYPVTQALWEAVMNSNPSWFKGKMLPVENVNWFDAREFISKLNALTGKNYRLPTEAEWEYAARGGKKSKGFTYAGSDELYEVGWYNQNAGNETHSVGEKKPNELGIYDMSGNVWEWCSDWYGNYPTGNHTNPQGAASGSFRVLRGGSWDYDAEYCRCARRSYGTPGRRYSNIGFRLVSPQ